MRNAGVRRRRRERATVGSNARPHGGAGYVQRRHCSEVAHALNVAKLGAQHRKCTQHGEDTRVQRALFALTAGARRGGLVLLALFGVLRNRRDGHFAAAS